MASPRFAADPPALRRLLALDGLDAVLHLRSGLTHILAPPAPQILEALEEGPADADEILRRIGELFDLEAEDAPAAIGSRLAELEAAGLVWRE
jgi:PqqD family protein of HPr-rel-A system